MSLRSDLRCRARLIEKLRRRRLIAKNCSQRGRSGHRLLSQAKILPFLRSVSTAANPVFLVIPTISYCAISLVLGNIDTFPLLNPLGHEERVSFPLYG